MLARKDNVHIENITVRFLELLPVMPIKHEIFFSWKNRDNVNEAIIKKQ